MLRRVIHSDYYNLKHYSGDLVHNGLLIAHSMKMYNEILLQDRTLYRSNQTIHYVFRRHNPIAIEILQGDRCELCWLRCTSHMSRFRWHKAMDIWAYSLRLWEAIEGIAQLHVDILEIGLLKDNSMDLVIELYILLTSGSNLECTSIEQIRQSTSQLTLYLFLKSLHEHLRFFNRFAYIYHTR